MPGSLLFEAVVFDLDGTLVATDRYWIPAARSATRRALAEFGLEELEVPQNREWLRIVGLPLAQGLERLFPELDAVQTATLAEYCVQAEEDLLSSGGAALLPGARDALDELATAGIRIGIASNCGSSYLNHVVSSLALDDWASELRCLDSPGIRDKGDMIEDILLSLGTRQAVMVGDRYGDEEAARSNAIPHVHVRTGYADASEGDTADLVLDDLSQLTAALRQRTVRVAEVLDELGVGGRSLLLGVTGRRASGKTFFARDLARVARERGLASRVVDLSEYRLETPTDPEDALGSHYDLPRLQEEVLEPYAADDGKELLILEGSFLLDSRIATQLDRLVYLDLPAEACLARFRGREARLSGVAVLEEAREALALEERFETRFDPRRADLVVDGRVFPGTLPEAGP